MVIEKITDENYKSKLKSKKAIVKFYADWCGSCRLFAPKFQKIATDEKYKNIDFFTVNAEKNVQFRKTAEVTTLPFFGYYEDGAYISGLSTAKEESLREYINKHTIGV